MRAITLPVVVAQPKQSQGSVPLHLPSLNLHLFLILLIQHFSWSPRSRLVKQALSGRVQGSRPVTLVGYGMGARVIIGCLLSLSEMGAKGRGIVETAVCLGTPFPASAAAWDRASGVCSHRLVNGFSGRTWPHDCPRPSQLSPRSCLTLVPCSNCAFICVPLCTPHKRDIGLPVAGKDMILSVVFRGKSMTYRCTPSQSPAVENPDAKFDQTTSFLSQRGGSVRGQICAAGGQPGAGEHRPGWYCEQPLGV
jgi:hypothetical protein